MKSENGQPQTGDKFWARSGRRKEQLSAIQRVCIELGPPPSMERGPDHLRKLLDYDSGEPSK